MRYKIIGQDLKVSSIALGTDVYGTDVDEKTAFGLLDFYTDNGGNLIDTANIYADWVPGERGMSEKLIGRWLRGKYRSDYVISTKGGHPELDSMHISRLSRDDIFSDMDESLRRLGTDYVDIYWLHRDDKNLPAGEIIEILNELVKQGKTRYIGMSNWSCGRIEEANRYAKEHGLKQLIASQIQYSLAIPNIENNDPTLVLMNDDEYEYFKNHDMTVFAFASQAKGFFSKMYAGGENSLSQKARDRYLSSQTLDRYSRIKKVAEEMGKTVGEIAIAGLIENRDFDTVAIVGCKNISQLQDTLGGWDVELSQDIVDFLIK